MPALQDALDTAEKQLQKINDDIKVREDQYQRLLSKRNAFSAGDDEYSQKALSMLAAELESKDTIELFEQARRTPRPEDDAVVARLRQLQQPQENLHNRIAELKAVQEQQRQALKELAELRDKFRRRNYDARYSSFPTDLGIGVILGEILRGGRSSGSAWERIGRSQRWEFPKGHRRSRGGFGGYGGMGSGGGFRTGGSF